MGYFYRKNLGMYLERIVDVSIEYYKEQGVCVIDKIPTPIKVSRHIRGSLYEAFFLKKSTVDYVGILRGGRGIAFDAKSTTAKKFSWKKLVKKHQRKYLKSFQDLGGLSFILLHFDWVGEWDNFYFIPFDFLLQTKGSLVPKDLEEFEVEYDMKIGVLRFLDGIGELDKRVT
ncbi:recombination protein U [Balnearium lithotrophicum]|uniref:Holliday junction resolvase RecU n=2 Tax=Balnearium lithotrophicum TaxID=223788 RepID=A0A521CK01_9BACT|nr:recombination protein U [Balnearium lithotrophicum]